ncbi:MAG: hypothetical protein GY822_02925 [Deltaproteobacteria bacterium]|nr:hypothetical protein [Deltaproteobacteria bacterium]
MGSAKTAKKNRFPAFSRRLGQLPCSLKGAWYFSSPVIPVTPTFKDNSFVPVQTPCPAGFQVVARLRYATQKSLLVVDEVGVQDIQGAKLPLTRRTIWHHEKNIHHAWTARPSPPLSLKMIDHPGWYLLLHYSDDVDGLVIIRSRGAQQILLNQPFRAPKKGLFVGR